MTVETMNTGDITRRIGLMVTADLIRDLGFKAVGQAKRATLWSQDDYPKICKALGKWVVGRAEVPMQPKPEKKEKVNKAVAASAPAVEDDDEL